jgi:hypothetical protein
MGFIHVFSTLVQDWDRLCFLLIFTLFLSFVVFASTGWAETPASQYIGADVCRECHAEKFRSWSESGHAGILRKASLLTSEDVPLPADYSLKDLSYVIGGFKWKFLYLDKEGHLVTSAGGQPGNNQYNIRDGEWVDYRAGERVPYTCGRCHTTGFSPDGNEGGLAGIKGTWVFSSVQCEACHGPGKKHADSFGEEEIETDKEVCDSCHQVQPAGSIPLQGVFLAPYTEGNQLGASPMSYMVCIDCHDPHKSGPQDKISMCGECHAYEVNEFKTSFKGQLGLTCVDCHMPPSGIIASGDPERFLGDFRSHLFQISHHEGFRRFESIDGPVNPGYLNVDYACRPCHYLFEDTKWARRYDSSIHRLNVTANLKIFRVQRTFTFTGLVFAFVSLLTGLGLKNVIRIPLNRKLIVSLHKHAVWITFGVYLAVGTTCLYFHAPFQNPEKLFNTGLFILHPLLGFVAVFLYIGKTVAVRVYHAGWRRAGWVLGTALFLFWILQYGTVLFK